MVYIVTFLFSLIFSSLSIFSDIFARLSYSIFALCIVLIFFWVISSVIFRIIKGRWLSVKPILCSVIVIIGCVGCVGVGYFRNPPPLPPENTDVLIELKAIFGADQGDRATWRYSRDPSRDKPRIERVMNLYIKRLLDNHEKKYYAAWVLHHGDTVEHYRIANELSSEAYKEKPNREYEWLMHATYDRLQQSLGKPQKYGTQYVF